MSDQLQDAISQKLSAFTKELVDLYRAALMEAVAQVVGAGGAVRRGPGRPPGTGKRRGRPPKALAAPRAGRGGRRRRSSTQIAGVADKIQKYVAANPGKRAEEIKKALGIPNNQWSLPIAKLLSTKKIRRTGARRATQYFAGGK